jgi:hypothetical protein
VGPRVGLDVCEICVITCMNICTIQYIGLRISLHKQMCGGVSVCILSRVSKLATD